VVGNNSQHSCSDNSRSDWPARSDHTALLQCVSDCLSAGDRPAGAGGSPASPLQRGPTHQQQYTEAAACTASQALAPFFWLLRAAPSVGRSRDLIQRFITRPCPESPCDSPDDVIRNFRLNRTRPPSHPVAPFSRFPACVPCSTEIESKLIFLRRKTAAIFTDA